MAQFALLVYIVLLLAMLAHATESDTKACTSATLSKSSTCTFDVTRGGTTLQFAANTMLQLGGKARGLSNNNITKRRILEQVNGPEEVKIEHRRPVVAHLPKLAKVYHNSLLNGVFWTATIIALLALIVHCICVVIFRDSPSSPDDNELQIVRPVPPDVYARFSRKKRLWLLLTDQKSGLWATRWCYFIDFTVVVSVCMLVPFSVRDVMQAVPGLYDSLMWYVLIVFTTESISRFYACPDLWAELKRKMTWLDFVCVIPCYMELVFSDADLELSIQALRVIRLIRILKLMKHSENVHVRVFLQALVTAKTIIQLSLALMSFVVLVYAVLIYEVEKGEWSEEMGCSRRRLSDGILEPGCSPYQDIPHACYWAVTTVTTVGYGDSYPITAPGKLLACLCMYSGIVSMAVPVGLLANHFQQVYDSVRKGGDDSAGSTDD